MPLPAGPRFSREETPCAPHAGTFVSPSSPPSRSGPPPAADAQHPEFAASFARATTALYEMINVPDGNGIPREALAKAHGVAVFPGVVKGAVLIGGYSG